MGWKKFFLGEPMPDKDDPRYRERYEREVEAGRRFARFLRLDCVAAAVQRYASCHTSTFFCVLFGFVLLNFLFNISVMVRHYNAEPSHPRRPAVQRLDSALSVHKHKSSAVRSDGHPSPFHESVVNHLSKTK